MLRRAMTGQAAVFALVLVVAPLAAAQTTGSSGQRGPSAPTGPKIALPDLVITEAKVTLTCVNGTVTANIVATVKNGDMNGTADLTKLPFAIVMEANWGSTKGSGSLEPTSVKTVQPQLGGPKTLSHGQTFSGMMTITGIPKFKPGLPKAGQYAFTVIADPMKAVKETNENNNTKLTYAYDPCFKQ